MSNEIPLQLNEIEFSTAEQKIQYHLSKSSVVDESYFHRFSVIQVPLFKCSNVYFYIFQTISNKVFFLSQGLKTLKINRNPALTALF